MLYLIDDIDEEGNIIEDLDECNIVRMEEDNPLTEILKLLYVDE